LETIKGEDNPTLCSEECAKTFMIGESERDQLLIAVNQVGDRALSEGNIAGEQMLMDLADAAVIGRA
jgi:hypothetical protein